MYIGFRLSAKWVVRLAVALILLGVVTGARAETMTQITAAASTLAGEPVQVVCESPTMLPSAYDGMTFADSNVIELQDSLCHALEHIDGTKNRYPTAYSSIDGHMALLTTGDAVLTLTHEAMHHRLHSSDEALVNCTAMQNRWLALNLLGVHGWVASAVAYGVRWNYVHSSDDYKEATCPASTM